MDKRAGHKVCMVLSFGPYWGLTNDIDSGSYER